MNSKKWKIKFENKINEKLIFHYFNTRNFEISKYRSFCILTLTHFECSIFGWGSKFQTTNVKRQIFRNLKITNIKIPKDIFIVLELKFFKWKNINFPNSKINFYLNFPKSNN